MLVGESRVDRGMIALMQGELDTAVDLLCDGMRRMHAEGDRVTCTTALLSLAWCAEQRGDRPLALRLAAASTAAHAVQGTTDKRLLAREGFVVAEPKSDDPEFHAWLDGRGLTLDQAVELGLTMSGRTSVSG